MFPLRFPFNWTTPVGYFIAMCIQTIQVYCASLTYICFMVIFFGICIFLMSFVDDLEKCVTLNEEKILASVHVNGFNMNRIQADLNKSLNELVRFHTEVKQLSAIFSFRCLLRGEKHFFHKKSKQSMSKFSNFRLALKISKCVIFNMQWHC